MDSPEKIALAFVNAINAGDLVALRAMMTEGHTFTDAKGASFSGADMMIGGWKHFIQAFPGYRIVVQHTFAEGNRVALFGYAEGGWRVDGAVLAQRWQVSAAWLAEVVSGKIDHWSVFCDTAWVTPPAGDAVF
jgi:ketosteroid isomerase-like protein